jgi:hypothetical protein
MNKLPTDRASRDWVDLIALIAILVTATMLIVLGHVTAGSFVTVCAALVTLYQGWSRFGSVRHSQRPPSDESPPDEDDDIDS